MKYSKMKGVGIFLGNELGKLIAQHDERDGDARNLVSARRHPFILGAEKAPNGPQKARKHRSYVL
jgi:hypothetical protein